MLGLLVVPMHAVLLGVNKDNNFMLADDNWESTEYVCTYMYLRLMFLLNLLNLLLYVLFFLVAVSHAACLNIHVLHVAQIFKFFSSYRGGNLIVVYQNATLVHYGIWGIILPQDLL